MKKKIFRMLVALFLITIMFLPLSIAVDERENGQTISGWLEIDKLTASDADFYDSYGYAVSLYGDYALVGSPCDNTFTGSAYIYRRDGEMWNYEQKLVASDNEQYQWFGSAVSIYGDYALIGSPGSNDLIGSVYVFKLEDDIWGEEDILTPLMGEQDDSFGSSLSLYEDYALIGAPYDDNQNGSAFVFKREGSSWVQQIKLNVTDTNTTFGAIFGHSVSLFGEYALIGAHLNEYTHGSAYVFKRDGENWIEQDKLSPSDGQTYGYFGYSVAIHGDYALIGAHNGGYGSGYIFQQSGNSWNQEQQLTVDDNKEGDWLGYSVSLNDDYALLGAPFKDYEAEGAAYVFKRSDSLWEKDGKLTASDGIEYINFGYSVSLSGNNALLGAPDHYWGMGSAYVFHKDVPESDLDCSGDLQWIDIEPNSTLQAIISIENVGEPESELDWEIQEMPEWGTWTIEPMSGEDLTPEDEPVQIQVEVIAPDVEEETFTGELIIVNKDNSNDFCVIDISLQTPVSQHAQNPLLSLLQRFIQKIMDTIHGWFSNIIYYLLEIIQS